jgi:type IV pilus assembly protein PilY1
LEVGSYGDGIEADSSDAGAGTGTWTINGKTVTLPVVASSTADAAGVIDRAGTFRYAKNYLNWMFFSGSYTGNGSDLPHKSRFYYAKTAIMTVAKLAANQAKFSIYNFTDSADGASNVQPLGMVVNTPLAALPEDNTLESNFINNINNMGTVTYSPLAEGLARVGGYYGSPSSSVVGYYCQNNFVIVVSPGISSEDQAAAAQSSPASLSDYDGDGSGDGNIGEGNIMVDSTKYSIPVNYNGTTYLDDVAYYLWANDIVDYQDGFQNVMTYTIGFMGDQLGNLFLKNTSNNGNGNVNLYDTSHEEYGKYHYEAEDPDMLASALLAAVNDILSATSSFTAPVVPVTRTTSGNRIYMAFFTPEEDNFWEGNVTKFGISDSNEIIDVSGNSATWPNGAIREDAQPYWQTRRRFLEIRLIQPLKLSTLLEAPMLRMKMETETALKTEALSPAMCFTVSRWCSSIPMPTTPPKPWFILVPMTACCMPFWMSPTLISVPTMTRQLTALKPGHLFHRTSFIVSRICSRD